MSRLNQVDPTRAQGEAEALLAQVQRQVGSVPNFMRVLANSPPALAAFLGLNANLSRGSLDPKTRERIALSTAEANGCEYCVSAHTALGKKAGLSAHEISAARLASSEDAKARAALEFAQTVLERSGDVSTAELNAVRAAGYDDGEIVEIISHVALNSLTNFLGKVGQIDIDFPRVALLTKSAA
ncbi:MAG: peroxidase-related enzyme [Planctomycetes bacterium]|nr:peroxidase-related enzyme [Planctomycetota bacterium]